MCVRVCVHVRPFTNGGRIVKIQRSETAQDYSINGETTLFLTRVVVFSNGPLTIRCIHSVPFMNGGRVVKYNGRKPHKTIVWTTCTRPRRFIREVGSIGLYGFLCCYIMSLCMLPPSCVKVPNIAVSGTGTGLRACACACARTDVRVRVHVRELII